MAPGAADGIRRVAAPRQREGSLGDRGLDHASRRDLGSRLFADSLGARQHPAPLSRALDLRPSLHRAPGRVDGRDALAVHAYALDAACLLRLLLPSSDRDPLHRRLPCCPGHAARIRPRRTRQGPARPGLGCLFRVRLGRRGADDRKAAAARVARRGTRAVAKGLVDQPRQP